MNPRIQRGSAIRHAIALPIMPIAPPVATITPSPGSVIPVEMAYIGGSGASVFEFVCRIGLDPPGIYTVSVSYLDGEGTTHTLDPFTYEVVPGGDSGGAVVAFYGRERPEGGYCLVQLAGGSLVQGRNPQV